MPSHDHTFLYASLGSKQPSTTRKIHIRRLYDIFQLSVSKRDLPRAKRAWSILVRCKEIAWSVMWTTGLLLLGDTPEDQRSPLKLDYLRTMMLQNTDERETILQELVLRLILCEKYRDALSELELYLPAFPFQDNPVLHTYAGLLCLFLAQLSPEQGFDPIQLRDAQSHFDQALTLEPENTIAQEFSKKIPQFKAGKSNTAPQRDLSDDEDEKDEDVYEDDEYDTDTDTPKAKKTRL